MKYFLSTLIFISTFFPLSVLAQTVCIRNAKEFVAAKSTLPVLFRELPVKLGGESPGNLFDVFASIKISIQNDAIVLHTDSWQGPLGHYRDLAEVASVCFDTDLKEMTISFKKGAKDFKAFYSDTQVRLPEITLKKINSAQESAILEKIYKKVPGKAMPIIEKPSAQKEVN